MSHLVCPKSKSNIVFKELTDSKKFLEDLLKKECEHFAFPGGLYSKRDLLLAKKANFKYIFSTFEKLPSKINITKANTRLHVRQSTLQDFDSIMKIDKYYYFMRYIRSLTKEIRDIIKFKTLIPNQ